MSQPPRAIVQSKAHRFLSSSMRSHLPDAEDYQDDYFEALREEDGPPEHPELGSVPSACPQTASTSSSGSSSPVPRRNKFWVFSDPRLLALRSTNAHAPSTTTAGSRSTPSLQPEAGPSTGATAHAETVVDVSGNTTSAPPRPSKIAAGAMITTNATTPGDSSVLNSQALPETSAHSLSVVLFSPAAKPHEELPATGSAALAPAFTLTSLPSPPPSPSAKSAEVLPSSKSDRPSSPAKCASPAPRSRKRSREGEPTSQPEDAPEPKRVKRPVPDIWKARPIKDTSALRTGLRRVRSPSPCEPRIPRARPRAIAASAMANGETSPPTPSRQSKRLQERTTARPDVLSKAGPKPNAVQKRAQLSKRKRGEDEDEDDDCVVLPKEKRTKRQSAERDELAESSASGHRDDDTVPPLALRRTKRKTTSPHKSRA